MYWGDVFTSPLFFINFPAYKNYTLTNFIILVFGKQFTLKKEKEKYIIVLLIYLRILIWYRCERLSG